MILPASAATQADYPNKPITLIVPYSAGGTTDQAARALAENLSRQLKQPVVIENKPGAGASMGVTEMLKASPDGYRLTLTPAAIFRQPHLQPVRYDPVRDLTYIAAFLEYDFFVTVPVDSPFKSVKDIVDYAKRNPGIVNYGTSGRFSGNHTVMAMLSNKYGVKFTHVPFKGDADSINSLLGGHLKMAMIANGVLPFMQSGRVHVLASAGDVENPIFKVPTLKALGYDVTVPSPLGIAGPKGLPNPIVEKLERAVKRALDDPGFKKLMDSNGVRSLYMDSEAYSRFARKAFVDEEKIVKNLGMETD
ncbi:tripartite tricarboxylate transporter substrate binding protein [Cupriavidus necator]|uniref:Tripartite tricarboxylate transporter substrate binding protein n=2 Tax=Cupriavidus necator TaxID=106590 RepID=A0A367PHC4_CUPNE|nr:tripartite tricarboxylate transporter substrate binding protein [Cupriavidus necator]